MFFANFSPPLVGKTPTFDSIDGGVDQTTDQVRIIYFETDLFSLICIQGFGFNGESDLDLEYGMALVFPQQVTLYQTGDVPEGASFNNFLDAIDGKDPTSPSLVIELIPIYRVDS